ncbi:hypothetical protein NSA50_17105 [Clostridium sp. DSM 100503]|uniref:hypothetical protein n=1 Tax=Clostridium sp. DSM 100503 TaxID=2963282 RepID=UPI00214A5876|nr:hypothetical protein [Clostridium sp. DSM 100503]MCR1952744.1 hypothetical protein [Clostridium sp. DSM 100503]
MNIKKIKEILTNKKVIVAGSTIISLVVIGVIAVGVSYNKNKVEDNKQIVETNKDTESTEEKEVKNRLEELKKIDISKLSEEDKKVLEDKISNIEKLVDNKEYVKATDEMESLKKDINSKIEELVKKEEIKEESNDKKEEENKEVASNNTTSNSSGTSSNSSSSNNSGSNGSTSNSTQGAVQKPAAPTVVEKPVQPTPQPKPDPQPPVVEEPKPIYPSVVEVKQRLIAYGQSLGLQYDASINYDNADKGTGTDQMWGSGLGGNADCQTLFNGLVSSGCYAFNVEVVDLGNGFCSMNAYGIMNWD